MSQKQVKYDIDGYDVMTSAIMELINQYPALEEGDSFAFSTLSEDTGKSMYPVSGAVVETSKEDITGHVKEVCLYPFYVIYRESGLTETNKMTVKEWLDNLGKWLERKTITIKENNYRLGAYPKLTNDREILKITRQTPSYLDAENENQSEDWVIQLSVRYQHEYDK